MSDRIHLAYCDQCGDEIYEGDRCRVVVAGPAECAPDPRIVRAPITRYTCERCIAVEVRQP